MKRDEPPPTHTPRVGTGHYSCDEPFWGERGSSHTAAKWPEGVGEGDWPGGFLWLEGGAGGGGFLHSERGCGL